MPETSRDCVVILPDDTQFTIPVQVWSNGWDNGPLVGTAVNWLGAVVKWYATNVCVVLCVCAYACCLLGNGIHGCVIKAWQSDRGISSTS